ncbi:prepilin-type N-terminal cleavage/methylation domain-containing protein [Bacillus sp. MRMR6]|uniref:prepilin-type N-terminal cleavage/methylation domain-containing protein n=1 Tax=Bacillus sp. MRMR6 TaxID=1928617 RepID=UPI000950BA95|nr:prepilin-type N-terminal cleavage/methylation domain-containing protein [Bacillus sp. MRMR6]OLS41520.1 hypothetical protein BTR25_02920 [Bacillus sp. MRMR6]
MLRHERGLTLVEVLATLTLLSVISIIIWSIFFQGYSFSQKAISKNFIQQETNLLITNLTTTHQTAKQYEILNSTDECKITVNIVNRDATTKTDVYSHPNMCFKFEIQNSVTNPVNPNLNNVRLKITTSDKSYPDNKITLNTFLYRVKGVQY